MATKVPRDSLHLSSKAKKKADVRRLLPLAAQPREASKPSSLPALPRATPSYSHRQSLDEDPALKEKEEEEKKDLHVEAGNFLKGSADMMAPEKLEAGDELLLEKYMLLPILPFAAPSYPFQQSLDEDPALREGEEEEEEEDLLVKAGKGEEEAGEEGTSADALALEMLTAEDELILEDYTFAEDKEARDEWEVTRCIGFSLNRN
jgi:hypothetical protein